jgi:L-lactate dehydrogenase complex protein LldF
MAFAKDGFIGKRANAISLVPEWEQIRAEARQLRTHAQENLDFYLEQYEQQVIANGGHVHWASTAEDACAAIVEICRKAGAKTVTKGKSMVGEEVGLNDALEDAGFEPIETDLGEYIIQLAGEPPSHIIAPAVHKTKDEVSDLFYEHHQQYGQTERITDRVKLVHEARRVLRDKFIAADVGITGANFLVAETGQHVLVTNEGNGDLTSCLPKVHIVITGIEKVMPTLEDTTTMLRLLARSATGQQISNYTSFYSGPKREGELDGPDEFHVVLVDNGRSRMLGGAFREMLRCIRCGACLNHCPVYGSIGGHAYGWVYAGPMGSVITPIMVGLEEAAMLPNACTLNGRCGEVCPMSIPLPDLLRKHRETAFREGLASAGTRWGLSAWAFFAKRPKLYQLATRIPMKLMGMLGKKSGRFRSLPLAGAWTKGRDMPAPQGDTFMAQWAKKKGERA